MKRLLVEGWRSSSQSYALVNQHQLLQFLQDPRFSLYHVDVPFLKAHDDFCPEPYTLKIEATPRKSPDDDDCLEPDLESIVHNMQTVTDGAAVYRAAALRGRQAIIDRYSWRVVTRTLGDLLHG